jgi:rare lipoprotein A
MGVACVTVARRKVMGSAHFRSARAGRAVMAVAACAALAACASAPPSANNPAGLFKAQVGDISGGVAPGPNSVWYVQNLPVAYVKMGFATWQPERPTRGLRAWLSRLLGRRSTGKTATEPTGVASVNLRLPVPARVQVTNVASGAMITVRIDDKAPMGDAVIRLSPETARSLGADPARPLLVRMRYLAPVIAYNERPTLRYALRSSVRHAPTAVQPAAPTVLAAQTKAPPVLPPAPAVPAPPPAIRVAEIHPASPQLRGPAPIPAVGGMFRVQAGAFASLANARRAVGMLEPAGPATIEPMQRGALTLYRVIVPGPKDANSAERLRARVAEIGFADARLIRPL